MAKNDAEFKAMKKAAAERYKENQAKAKETLKSFLSTKPDLPTEVEEAIKYLSGAGKTERVSRPGVNDVLRAALIEAGSAGLSAIEIFEKFEFGRPTMEQKIRTFIKAKDENDRLWVAFEDGIYRIMGEGPEAPEGWTGYLPVAKEDL